MPVSLSMLGILLMLDICFVVNYFVIRALRRWTDSASASLHASSEEKYDESQKRSSDAVSNHFSAIAEAIHSKFEAHEEAAFAWIFGSVKLDPLRVRTFPGWQKIPYNIGLLTTCMFIVLACTLLSPNLITKQVGVASGSMDTSLCVDQDYAHGIDNLREELEEMTNLKVAKKQYQFMHDFHEALVNDTALYGIPPYECPTRGNVSGSKEEWTDFGPFFPGYCERALEAAIVAAQSRECVEQVCDCPTLPDTAVFEMTGLANKRFCGEVCVDVPYPCPQHSAEIEADLADYRWQQFQTAETKRSEVVREYPTSLPDNMKLAAMETAEKILFQVDVASYVYIGYSCVALFFPTPLILFRSPYWIAIKRFFFGVQKPFFLITVVAIWWGVEYFQALYFSPDIRLFLNNLRVGDPCFIDTGYLIDRQQVLNEICQELVPLEPQWNVSLLTVEDVLSEVSHFVDDCNCSYPNQHLPLISNRYASIADEIGLSETLNLCQENEVFDHCIIQVPQTNIPFLGNASICVDNAAARKLILEAPDKEPDWYDLWLASGFLATLAVKFAVANFGLALMKLADPFVSCAGQFLWVPSEFGLRIKSDNGQPDQLVLETLKDGNQPLAPGYLNEWFKSKKRALFHVGLSQTVLWGFLVHLCMFNLVFAVYDEISEDTSIFEMVQRRDLTVLGACLGFVAIVATVGLCTLCYIQRIIGSRTKVRSEIPEEEELSTRANLSN